MANNWLYDAVLMCPVIPLVLILFLKSLDFRLLYDGYNHSALLYRSCNTSVKTECKSCDVTDWSRKYLWL